MLMFILAAATGWSDFVDPPFPKAGTPEWFEKLKEIQNRPLPPSAGDVLYRELRKMHGQPAHVAFDRLGYPDKKLTVDGAVVYSWVNENTNRDGSPLRCTVKVIVRKGLIASTDFRGNEGACATYAQALDPSYHLP